MKRNIWACLVPIIVASCSGDDSYTEELELGQVEQEWCIGCLAGVSTPEAIPFGYGLRPINQTVGGRSTQFPACQGTHSSMPHACRTPTGNAVWFASPPASWATGDRRRYWDAVSTVGAELSNAGWAWGAAWDGNVDPWDSGAARYQHTEVIPKALITNSPHPLFKLTLQSIQNTPVANIKTYLACEIEFDFRGPLGIHNNGGNCTGECAANWDASTFDKLRQAAFLRGLSRCIGLGGDSLPIYEHPVSSPVDACWTINNWSCASGGGDGLLRKEWFPAGWWSQRYWKSCTGNNPQTPCNGIWQQPMGVAQYLSGTSLLWGYWH